MLLLALALPIGSSVRAEPKAESKPPIKPLKALLITGGCCHDYAKQKELLKAGIEARAHVQVDLVHSTSGSTKARFDIYEKADWANGYDVVIHDECTSDVTEMPYVGNILAAHKGGVPAVNLHCAMHCYRTGTNDWFEFVGIQSTGHGPQLPIKIEYVDKEHAVAQGLPNWTTVNEELYNNVKVLDSARPLARGSQDRGKALDDFVVTWVNQYGKTRVFSTTLGHNNETVGDPRYLDLVTRGLLWSCDKLNDSYLKPKVEAAAVNPADGERLKLLIVDGQNNHNWKAMTPLMKAELEQSGRFIVDVATTPDNKAPKEAWDAFRPDFSKYAVVLSNYNGQSWPAEVQANLVQYVGGGGGLVIIHAANNAFSDWPEWNQMIGLGWRGSDFGDRITLDEQRKVVRVPKNEGPGAGHGRTHEFIVETLEAEHPVMKGLPEKWLHANDELYHGQRGPAQDMRILAAAFSAKETGGTGAYEPMIWWIPFGKGRVFTTLMGHVGDTRAIRCIGFITIMNRGAEWAATGRVTLPIPDNFPTATKTSLVPEPAP